MRNKIPKEKLRRGLQRYPCDLETLISLEVVTYEEYGYTIIYKACSVLNCTSVGPFPPFLYEVLVALLVDHPVHMLTLTSMTEPILNVCWLHI